MRSENQGLRMLSRLLWLFSTKKIPLWTPVLFLRVTVPACRNCSQQLWGVKRDVYKCDFPSDSLDHSHVLNTSGSWWLRCLSMFVWTRRKTLICAVHFALLYFSGSLEPHCWDLVLLQAGCHGTCHWMASEGLWEGGLCEASWTWTCTSLNNWGFLMFSRYSLTLPPRSYWFFF